MPEIGYWKYIRFNDDEKQYWGTDDDITIVFDSADDRLEFRMKKDIRYEDDTGAEILTIQKATRTLVTGNIDMQGNELQNWNNLLSRADVASPCLTLRSNIYSYYHLRPSAGNVLEISQGATPGATVIWTVRYTGLVTQYGDLDLNNYSLKNAKLGSPLNANGYPITGPAGDAGELVFGAGSAGTVETGGLILLCGIYHPANPGALIFYGGKVAGGYVKLKTFNAALTEATDRFTINQGNDPDIDILNSKLDLHDQALEATAGAIAGYFRLRVGGT